MILTLAVTVLALLLVVSGVDALIKRANKTCGCPVCTREREKKTTQ